MFTFLHRLSSGPRSVAAFLLGFFSSSPWSCAVCSGLGDTAVFMYLNTPPPPTPADWSGYPIGAREGGLGLGGVGLTPRKLRAELQEGSSTSLSNGDTVASVPLERSARSTSPIARK